jgi:hypothetical protein
MPVTIRSARKDTEPSACGEYLRDPSGQGIFQLQPLAAAGTMDPDIEHHRNAFELHNSGWRAARRRASKRYTSELGRSCPKGFQSIRVHDLKHTYGHRLRAAGVGFEDRQLLLGHKAGHVTTHYSAPEIEALMQASEKVCELGSRKIPTLAIVQARAENQVLDFTGGERGTRTLDLGIMSATL